MKENKVNKVLATCLTLIVFSLAFSIYILSKETDTLGDKIDTLTGYASKSAAPQIVTTFAQTSPVATAPTQVSGTSTTPVPVTPLPYCSIPTVLVPVGYGMNRYDFVKIDGRNVVYIDNNNNNNNADNEIKFYDLGLDHKQSSDDLGIIQLPLLQTGLTEQYRYVQIYGKYIIFQRTTQFLRQVNLMVYSIGNDGIAGTSDDNGPYTIYTIYNIPNANQMLTSAHIGDDFISFAEYDYISHSYNHYYCTLDNNECQTGIIHVIPIPGQYISTGGVGYGSSSYFNYIFRDQLTMNLYSVDNSLIPSLFINNAEELDTSSPFVLINVYGVGLGLGIPGITNLILPISPPIGAPPVDLSHNLAIGASGNYFSIAWNTGPAYKVSTYPPTSVINLPLVNGGTTKIAIDDSTLIVKDYLGNIYASECYF